MSRNQPTTVYLPPPNTKGERSLEEAIAARRSVRDFAPNTLAQVELAQLLWAAQGTSDRRHQYRTAPSAGATYPLEIFVVAGKEGVEGMEEGIFHYVVDDHCLTMLQKGDKRQALASAALKQDSILQAPLDIVICAVYERTCLSYGGRGARYVHMEAGHAGENIYLQAAALGLGTVAIGAFNDDEVGQALGLDEQYHPLYIMPVGIPARR